MKVNDVIARGDAAYRILVLENEQALCINCAGKTMPKWFPLAELADCLSANAPSVDGALTLAQRRRAHERFTLIAPIQELLKDGINVVIKTIVDRNNYI